MRLSFPSGRSFPKFGGDGAGMRGLSLALSVLVHVVVAVALLQAGSGNSMAKIDLNRRVYTVDLVTLKAPGPAKGGGSQTSKPAAIQKKAEPKPTPKPAAKVEPKPTPKDISPAKKAQDTKPKAKPETKPKPETKAKPKEEPKKRPEKKESREDILASALGSAREQAARSDRAQKDTVAGALAQARQEAAAVGSPGEGGEGSGGATLLDIYASLAEAKVKENWRFPRIGGGALVVGVEIDIDDAGTIVGSRIVESSGRSDFDASAMQAVAETKVFPKPPLGIRRLVIRFNLNELIS